MPSESSSKVAFFHIAKTGGLTFRGVLDALYGDSAHSCIDPSLGAIENAIHQFDCLDFHLAYRNGAPAFAHSELAATRRWNILDGTNKFTLMRDPVDRSVSNYYQMLELRGFHSRYFFEPYRLRFPESLEEYADTPYFSNLQLHWLQGNLLKPSCELGQVDLAQAKEWLLEHNVHVGLTERFSDSIHVLQKVINRALQNDNITLRQQNRKRPDLADVPKRVREKLIKANELDIELYEFGRNLFEQDIREFGSGVVYSYNTARFADLGNQANQLQSTADRIPTNVFHSKIFARAQQKLQLTRKLTRVDQWWHLKTPPALAVACATAWASGITISSLWLPLILIFAAVCAAAVYAYVIEDFLDLLYDVLAGKNTQFMRLSPKKQRVVLFGAMFLNLLVLFALRSVPVASVCFALIGLISTAYVIPRIHPKTRGFWGVTILALGDMLMTLLSVFTTAHWSAKPISSEFLLTAAVWSFALGCRIAFSRQIRDLQAGCFVRLHTFAGKHGVNKLNRWARSYVLPIECMALLAFLTRVWGLTAALACVVVYAGLVSLTQRKIVARTTNAVAPTHPLTSSQPSRRVEREPVGSVR